MEFPTDVEPITFTFEAVRDVHILLFTRNNSNNPHQLNFLDLGQVRGSYVEEFHLQEFWSMDGWKVKVRTSTLRHSKLWNDFNVKIFLSKIGSCKL